MKEMTPPQQQHIPHLRDSINSIIYNHLHLENHLLSSRVSSQTSYLWLIYWLKELCVCGWEGLVDASDKRDNTIKLINILSTELLCWKLRDSSVSTFTEVLCSLRPEI